jgi:hypothetical protein
MDTRREIEIEATPDQVWEALADERERAEWLDAPEREIHVETVEAPHRLVWWWWTEDEPATRVELLVVAAPAGARVLVIESEPAFPLTTLAAHCGGLRALALA